METATRLKPTEEETFEIDWTEDRDLATARMQVGDMEVVAHCHLANDRRTGTDSLGFTRNAGMGDRPFMDFGTHLPAGGYRRLAAMLTQLADAVDAAASRACPSCADGRHTECSLGTCPCKCVTSSHG